MNRVTSWLMALLPILYCIGMQSMFLLDASDTVLFGLLGGYLALGLIISAVHAVGMGKAAPAFAAKANLWVLASNLLLFAGCLILLAVRIAQNRAAEADGAMEGGLAVFLLILIFIPHWLTYLVARICGALCCARNWPNKGGAAVLTVILSLFPVADVVCAAMLLRAVSRFQRCQQSPIES